VGLVPLARVSAAPCVTAAIKPRGADRAHVLAEAEAHVAAQRYPEARAMFGWMLARNPKDRDARFALAKINAWERCFESAAAGYREVLRAEPADMEARAGLVDMLLWDGRWPEARAVIDAGLRISPAQPELWLRRARLLLWTGDTVRAVAAADRAEQLAPNDLDLRAWRDALFLGQLRAGVRADFYPAAYPSIYAANLQVLQRWHAFDLAADAQAIERTGGYLSKPLIDGRYALSAIYRATGDLAAGLSLGFGAPAKVVPQYEAKVSVWATVWVRWTGSFAYSFWHYRDDKSAHIFAPTLAYALNDDLQLEARAWISYLVLPRLLDPALTKLAVAAGVRGIWHVWHPLRLMLSYTYGPQFDTYRPELEQPDDHYGFLSLKSHIVGLSADWLIQRAWGLVPGVGFERRQAPNGTVVHIFLAELSSYFRW
jgi:tetratricopeptide (TPR) repeat protein